MTDYSPKHISIRLLLYIICMVISLLPLLSGRVSADSLTQKSVVIGSVTASAVTNHQFQFDINTGWSLGSIAFQYCEDPLFSDPCIAPSGLDVSGAVLTAQTGQTGFSVHPNTSSNRIVITRTPILSSVGTVSYNFNDILNPDTPNKSTFVRITTYTNSDATGGFQDNGVAAFSITPALGVNVFVPPYLAFCVGITVGIQCESSSGLGINLGNLNPNRTSYATTQFAGATNDDTGYSVSVIGTTMTSGTNEIYKLSSPSPIIPGSRQFGINLSDNSNPDSGNNVEGIGSLVAASPYAQPNLFTFNNGDVISNTASPTEYNRMTVTYVVNIEPKQPPGTYSTTLTYVAMASF